MGGEIHAGTAAASAAFHPALWSGAFGAPNTGQRRHGRQPAPAAAFPRTSAAELNELREELHRLQRMTGKATLYRNIKLDPRCSDAEVFSALKRFKIANAAGERLSPNVRYAIEVLGTPATRERYDRKLVGMLSNQISDTEVGAEQFPIESRSWFNAAFFFVGVALLLPLDHDHGPFGPSHMKKITSLIQGAVNKRTPAIDYAAEIEKRDLTIKMLTDAREREQLQLRQVEIEAQQKLADRNRRLQLEAQAVRDSQRREEERQRVESQNRGIALVVHQRQLGDAQARGNTSEVERLLRRGPSYY